MRYKELVLLIISFEEKSVMETEDGPISNKQRNEINKYNVDLKQNQH